MYKTVVINVVGLSSNLIGADMPFLSAYLAKNKKSFINPMLPAVTCSVQATYLTGKAPSEHGIVGNGWYFRDECEVRFWKQSNKLVQSEKIWESAKKKNENFTCANHFWWYNMYSSVDYSITPRPMYTSRGGKFPDVYTHPGELRDLLQEKLGTFPLFKFWGPKTSIESSRWIAEAAKIVDNRDNPTLTLIYLPHLDYCLQKFGPDAACVKKDLKEIDEVIESLVKFYEQKNTRIIILSEYGITKVDKPIHINRVLRQNGYLTVRLEKGREMLDPGASKAFAVADHQLAHIYINDISVKKQVIELLENTPGIEKVIDESNKSTHGLAHERAGEVVAVADSNSWFTYYYWMDDTKAPDYARTVDIHRKPGYDPVEMFIDPSIRFPLLKVGKKILAKKLGFNTLMDVIPLDAQLIKGSHGRVPEDKQFWPVCISNFPDLITKENYDGTEIRSLIEKHIFN